MMDTMEKMMELSQQGNNCCQIIACFLAEPCGFEWEKAREELSVMCSTCGGTCSALRGGTYGLSMYGKQKGYGHEEIRKMSDRLYDQFEEKHGGILCKEISKNDMMVCAQYVKSVIELTQRIVEENEKASAMT